MLSDRTYISLGLGLALAAIVFAAGALSMQVKNVEEKQRESVAQFAADFRDLRNEVKELRESILQQRFADYPVSAPRRDAAPPSSLTGR